MKKRGCGPFRGDDQDGGGEDAACEESRSGDAATTALLEKSLDGDIGAVR